MGGDNRLTTENFLRLNFIPKNGITPGTENTLHMDCDQITSRYNVVISGISNIGLRLPSQNQLNGVTPIVETLSQDNPVSNGFKTLRGELTNHLDVIALSYGICYNSQPNPTIETSAVEYSNNMFMGVFSVVVELDPYVKHYVRAFVTTINGTTYGTTYYGSNWHSDLEVRIGPIPLGLNIGGGYVLYTFYGSNPNLMLALLLNPISVYMNSVNEFNQADAYTACYNSVVNGYSDWILVKSGHIPYIADLRLQQPTIFDRPTGTYWTSDYFSPDNGILYNLNPTTGATEESGDDDYLHLALATRVLL